MCAAAWLLVATHACRFWLQWPLLTLQAARYGLLRFHFGQNTAAENTSNVVACNLTGRHAATTTIFSLVDRETNGAQKTYNAVASQHL